jgi:hypothetical protein
VLDGASKDHRSRAFEYVLEIDDAGGLRLDVGGWRHLDDLPNRDVSRLEVWKKVGPSQIAFQGLSRSSRNLS